MSMTMQGQNLRFRPAGTGPRPASGPARRPGFTLVELLVVLGLGIIVSGLAFSLYGLSTGYYLQGEEEIRRQQNLRTALDRLSRDLRMAGNGFQILGANLKTIQAYVPFSGRRACGARPVRADALGWFHHCEGTDPPGVRPLFGEDGGRDDSDIVTIFRSEPQFSTCLGEAAELKDHEIILTGQAAAKEAAAAGDILALVSGSQAVLMEAGSIFVKDGLIDRIYINPRGRFTGPDIVPPGFAAAGARIYNLKDVSVVTYFVDQTRDRLMVINHDQKYIPSGETESPALEAAGDIEDLQLYYFFENEKTDLSRLGLDPSIGAARLDRFQVPAAAAAVTAKSVRKYGRETQVRPALFNREAGRTRDRSVRSSQTAVIQLRNFEK